MIDKRKDNSNFNDHGHNCTCPWCLQYNRLDTKATWSAQEIRQKLGELPLSSPETIEDTWPYEWLPASTGQYHAAKTIDLRIEALAGKDVMPTKIRHDYKQISAFARTSATRFTVLKDDPADIDEDLLGKYMVDYIKGHLIVTEATAGRKNFNDKKLTTEALSNYQQVPKQDITTLATEAMLSYRESYKFWNEKAKQLVNKHPFLQENLF